MVPSVEFLYKLGSLHPVFQHTSHPVFAPACLAFVRPVFTHPILRPAAVLGVASVGCARLTY